MGIPGAHPPAALTEADAVAARGPAPGDRRDERRLELVTIDPPGSRDLDQAVLVERRADGFRVR
jgi:exoribonuclease R